MKNKDEEYKLDLIKFDEGLKELVPEIFIESVERNNGLDIMIDLGIVKMQKYDLKVFRNKT